MGKPLHGPAGTRAGKAGQYLRGGGDRRALGLRDRREEQEPRGGVAKHTLLAEGRLQARARPQPRGPQPSPPAWPPKWPREPSASEALTGRVTLGMFGNIGGCCHQRGRCYGGHRGGYAPSGAQALTARVAQMPQTSFGSTLHPGPESHRNPGQGPPSRLCAQPLPQAPTGGPPLPC